MIKKRSRPTTRVRELSPDEPEPQTEEGLNPIPISDLLEFRKFKKTKLGIDSNKLSKGDGRRSKRTDTDLGVESTGGLRRPEVVREDEDDDDEKGAKARRAIRSNNFTGQTDVLDVNKHMMAYIEENLRTRARPKGDEPTKPVDPDDELYAIADRWKVKKALPATENEGSVTNSMTMLTAIPEVDLGMDSRLKNIEDTERAKRQAAEADGRSNTVPKGEEHLAASRYYQPNLKSKSDAAIIRDAKLEAMGLPKKEERHSNMDGPQMATDEAVMERFKKRMRK